MNKMNADKAAMMMALVDGLLLTEQVEKLEAVLAHAATCPRCSKKDFSSARKVLEESRQELMKAQALIKAMPDEMYAEIVGDVATSIMAQAGGVSA